MTCVIHCYAVLAIVSNSYPPLQGRLPTRYSPVRNSSARCKHQASAFYLHVLGTPPAFILSQDQTLIKNLSRVQIWLWSLSIPFTVLGLYQTCVCYVLFEILYLEFQGCHVVNFSRFFVVELISDNFYMLSHSVFFVNNFFNFFFDVLHAFQMRIIMKFVSCDLCSFGVSYREQLI